MGFTIKTAIKLFMLFLFFQVSINFFIETIPNLITLDNEEEDYLDFITAKTNAQLDAEGEANSLLDNFKSSIQAENLFNSNIIESFLGVLQVIGTMLSLYLL